MRAEARAGGEAPADDAEVERQVIAQTVVAAALRLQLPLAEVGVACEGARHLRAEVEARRELPDEGGAAREDGAARPEADRAGQGVAREDHAAVQAPRRRLRQGLLQDAVQREVGDAGAELVPGVPRRQLDAEARGERRTARAVALPEKVVLDREVRVSEAEGGARGRLARVEDGDERRLDTDLDILQQPVGQLEARGVLLQVGERRRLEQVELVAEFEVEFTPTGHVRVVGDEGLLRAGRRRRREEETDEPEDNPPTWSPSSP